MMIDSNCVEAPENKGNRDDLEIILPGNCMPLRQQTTEGSPSGLDKLEVVASFCYLGDMQQPVV